MVASLGALVWSAIEAGGAGLIIVRQIIDRIVLPTSLSID